jgi:hypothetical protein
MDQFSTTTQRILKANGWTKDRRIDIDRFRASFEEYNQQYSDTVLRFLESFGDLKIRFETSDYVYRCTFDVIMAIESTSLERVKKYQDKWIKRPICVIGKNIDHETIFMTQEGAMYGAFDSWVFKFGDTWEESIENICTQGEREQILESE